VLGQSGGNPLIIVINESEWNMFVLRLFQAVRFLLPSIKRTLNSLNEREHRRNSNVNCRNKLHFRVNYNFILF
jgi:hypothetical protein